MRLINIVLINVFFVFPAIVCSHDADRLYHKLAIEACHEPAIEEGCHELDGTWYFVVQVANVPGIAALTLTVDDTNSISGKYVGLRGEADISGTVSADRIEIEVALSDPLSYSGTFEDGYMKGTSRYGILPGIFEAIKADELIPNAPSAED